MGVEMLEMVVKMRKIVIFTTRRCYRSVCSHPFLVGMLCFLVFLYRSSPFVFSLLVSASPVLVCTAVLLGTLLTFGQPNIPEVEKDEQTTHEVASLKTGVSGDAFVVKMHERYSAEKFTDERGDVVEQLSGFASSIANRSTEHHRGDSLDSGAPLLEERSREVEFEIRAVAEEGRKIHDEAYEQKDELDDQRLVDGEAKVDDEDLELENDKSLAESFDSERVNVDSLDSPPGSPWKHAGEGEEQEEEEDEDDDEAIDSGSDRAESSSPDASMADIIPLLDELHPLLDEDAPQPVSLSRDGSDVASERSFQSSDSSNESDDNEEKHEDTEVADDDNEDADDDDEGQGNTEGQTKSAITWTEEDQKNLMDLGTSELERNQRLESLIARRRARKIMSMMPERNLIDLESSDLPFNIAPISTARNNPFDLPHDSYSNMGLPPIPGSAPSILLPRRNPFDLPYDSSEEKLDLTGDSFEQEFAPFQPKEPFFRRHESFNVGPSFFGPGRQERLDGRLRPYFVTERMDSDGASYSSFQRQSSGLSDSKASSVPETDSVASAGDIDEKNLFEETISHQAEPLNSVPEIQLRDIAKNVDDKNLSVEDISHELDLISLKEDKSPGEEGICPEQELISNIEHVSQHVGHGSQSSEETASLELGEEENRDVEANEIEIGLRHLQHHYEDEPVLFGEGRVSNPTQSTETHSNAETVKHGHKTTSSSSSLSEVSERIFCEREAAGLPNFVERSDHIVEDAGISAQYSQEGSDLNMTSDTAQKEPVFDLSPPAIRKSLSSSSLSSDLHVDSEVPPMVIKTTVSFADRESESGNEFTEKNISDDNDLSALVLQPINENQSESMMVTEISENPIMQLDLSVANLVSNNTSASVVPESNVNHASTDSNSSQDSAIEGHLMYQHGSEYQADQSFSSVDADIRLVVHNVMPSSVECIATSSEDQKLSQSSETSSPFVEQVLLVNVPYTTSQSMAEQSVDKEVSFQPELDPGLSLISGTDVGDGDWIEPEEKQISVHDQSTCEEKLIAECGEELVFLDKAVDKTSSRDNHEEETAITPEEIIEELSSRDNSNIPDAQELEHEVSLNMNSPVTPESISILSDAYESRAAEGSLEVESNSFHNFGNDNQLRAIEDSKFSAEATASQVNVQNIDDDADEIKEIDEVLLSELDAVGDFSIQELRSTSNEFEKHVASIEDGLSASHVTIPNTSVLDDDFTKMHENESELHMMNVRAAQGDKVTQYVEVKCVSEPQTSWTSLTEHTNLSSASSIEEVQNYIDPLSTQKEILLSQNQIGLANFRLVQNSNAEVVNPQMPLIEARSLEDIEAIFKKSEMASAEKETLLGNTEISPQGQANEASSSGMPVLEAQTLLDIDSTFKQMFVKIIEEPIVSESPSAKPALEEITTLGSKYHEQHEGSSLTKLEMELTIPTAIPVEDDDFDLKQPIKFNAERDMLLDSVDTFLHVGEIKDSEQASSQLPIVQTVSLNDPSLALTQASEYQQDKGLQSSAELIEENVAGTSGHLQSSANKLDVQDVRNEDEKPDNSSESPESLTADDAGKVGERSHRTSSSSSSSSISDSSSSNSDYE